MSISIRRLFTPLVGLVLCAFSALASAETLEIGRSCVGRWAAFCS